MGASGSVQSNSDNTIYISYDNNCDIEYKELCIEKLTEKGYTIVSKNTSYIINAKYVFIFISGHTTKSALQSRDINVCVENNKPIIYLITDRDYLPSINASIYNFISGNSYYPFYDKDSVISSINEFNFI